MACAVVTVQRIGRLPIVLLICTLLVTYYSGTSREKTPAVVTVSLTPETLASARELFPSSDKLVGRLPLICQVIKKLNFKLHSQSSVLELQM